MLQVMTVDFALFIMVFAIMKLEMVIIVPTMGYHNHQKVGSSPVDILVQFF